MQTEKILDSLYKSHQIKGAKKPRTYRRKGRKDYLKVAKKRCPSRNLSWSNFNESGDFEDQIEEYKNFTGYYPSSVHVDKIYRTKANRAWCKERGIRSIENAIPG